MLEQAMEGLNKGYFGFCVLKKIWISTHISRNNKIRLFNAGIKSVVLYGIESWKQRTTYASIVRQQKRLLAHHDFQRIPLEKHKL